MEFTLRVEGYVFAGTVQRTIYVEGTGISGTATEQRTGGWAWFLRYPDGEWVGEGGEATWQEVLRGMRTALAGEMRYGRLGYPARGGI